MEVIEEVKGCTGIAFRQYRNDVLVQYVAIDGFKRVINDFSYYILIDHYGRSVDDAYKYLNRKLGGESLKKRDLAFAALKLLYSFLYLSSLYDLKEINETNIAKFDEFLEGGSRKAADYAFLGTTIRSNSTINKYYSVYRGYYQYLGINNSIFEELKGKRYFRSENSGMLAHMYSNREPSYTITKKEVRDKEIPKFISLEEYNKVINLINEHYTLREELIVRLMYEYGMRLGEVLGLTLEDIIGPSITKADYGKLILRNRYTDKDYQWAKGCMKVTSRNKYNNPDYHKEGLGKTYGCESIKISLDTFNKLQNYLKLTRSPEFFGIKAFKNLKNKNNADKVTQRVEILKNSYVFVNKNGTPLSGNGWGDILKDIFVELDISVDEGKKIDGLSHRFRHGFAMFKVIVEKCDRLELKTMLRHTSISSCEVYYNLSESQKSELVMKSFSIQKAGGMKI